MLQDELTVGLRRIAAELDELAAETRPTIPPFPVIPDFEPLGLLGCGGMGAVYAARQVSLARDVAVKVVATSGTGTSFPEEARTVARLHHPNIVQVFAAGRTEGVAWFAMELVPGESADRHVFASAEDVARLGVAVADALAYAHRCGLLHRDVKPSNIFVGEDGAIKLGDFGLACLAADKLSDRSGTRHYLAPERLNGGAATAAGDLYALGVTLRDLGACKDFRIPTDFAAICAKAAASEPSARYTDANALADDLRRFLAHRPVAANPPAPLRRFRLLARRNPLRGATRLRRVALSRLRSASSHALLRLLSEQCGRPVPRRPPIARPCRPHRRSCPHSRPLSAANLTHATPSSGEPWRPLRRSPRAIRTTRRSARLSRRCARHMNSARSGSPARAAPFSPPTATPRGLHLVAYASLQTNVRTRAFDKRKHAEPLRLGIVRILPLAQDFLDKIGNAHAMHVGDAVTHEDIGL